MNMHYNILNVGWGNEGVRCISVSSPHRGFDCHEWKGKVIRSLLLLLSQFNGGEALGWQHPDGQLAVRASFKK